MAESQLPNDVCEFIEGEIASVEQLEILLLLFREPARRWTASAVGTELRSNEHSAATRLGQLVEQGFVLRDEDCFTYALGAWDAIIKKVGQYYVSHRVSVITSIVSRPPSALRSFANAFKLRKG